MGTVVGTNYFPFRPDVWSNDVNRFFYKKLACAPFFWDLSGEVAAGGKTIIIPSLTETFSAHSITTTTGAITDITLSDTVQRLDVDKWYGASRIISDYMAAQVANGYGSLPFYQEDLGYALAQQFDQDLIRLADAGGLTDGTSTATSTSSLTGTALEAAIRIMASYSVPRQDLQFFLHPTSYWAGPMKRQKFYDASQFGKMGPGSPIQSGVFDLLYGIPVMLTEMVQKDKAANQHTTALGGRASGYNNFLAHKQAFAYAVGNLNGPKTAGVRVKMIPQVGGDYATRITADIMYGVKRISGTRFVTMKCSTGG